MKEEIEAAEADVVESAAMPVKLRVKEMAEARGYQNARELADAAGIAITTAYAYWDNTSENFSRTVLGKICQALGVHVYALIDDDFTFTETVDPQKVRQKPRGRPRKARNGG